MGEEATLFAAVLQAFEEAGAAWEPVLDVVCRLGSRLTGDPWVIRLVDEHGSQHLGGVAAPDPAFEADLRRVIEEADPAYSNSLVAQVLRDGRPVLLTQPVLAAARDSVAPQHRALAEAHGIVGGALLPMRVRGATIGSLWVPCTAHHGRHDDDDLRFFADVADRCALAIDNARLLRQLQAQQDRHAALLAHVSDAIAVVDHAGVLVQASAGVRRQLGWTEAELLGTNVFDLVHADDAAAALGGFLNVIDVDDRPPTTLRVKHADGTWRWMDINADNLLEHPAVRGVVITAHDVTERVAADVLLNAENEVLELIATGAPVDEVLTSVCALADGHLRAGLSSVWLLDQITDDLIAAAGPLGVFAVASQGEIGATWARSLVDGRVAVSDPHDAPEWERFRDLALNANIGCSWTRSISDSAGELVGAVIVYVGGTLRKPSALEAKVMELAARLAGLAVERSRSAERLAHAATHDAVTGLPNRRLLHERLRTAVGHQSDINVAINVSSRQLAEKSFGDAVAAKLAETGFPARRLVLELTETVMMEDWDSARAVVAKMQALGVHLSIDDFGTGHSTLARLRQFPASGLKLDRTFVLELGRTRRQRTSWPRSCSSRTPCGWRSWPRAWRRSSSCASFAASASTPRRGTSSVTRCRRPSARRSCAGRAT